MCAPRLDTCIPGRRSHTGADLRLSCAATGASQAAAISEALATPGHRVWVADQSDGVPVGFLVARADRGSSVGEIVMVAVDPTWQNRGIATTLTDAVTTWLRQSGMQVAIIETGADPGHAPAQHAYHKAGYTALPAMRFFKSL